MTLWLPSFLDPLLALIGALALLTYFVPFAVAALLPEQDLKRK